MTGRCERCRQKRVSLCRRRICQSCAWSEYEVKTLLPGSDPARVRTVFMRTWDIVADAIARR